MKKSTTKQYLPNEIEPKWQSKWENEKIYHPDLQSAKKPFYNLMMFPYPSAEGMHAGNFFTFTGVDIYGRFKRMQGYDVFEPIGLDGFGIHSENYALKVGSHPVEQAKKSEENFYRQFRSSGNSYDWDRTVETYKPDYYKWTQWLFTELFKEGLAYRKKSPVNFCPSCKTVLADEQVIDGKCERCGSIVEKKNLEQWFFRITKYADRLLANIEELNWTEKVKIAQRNWIGKKEGVEITYPVILGSTKDDSRISNESDPGHGQDDNSTGLSVSVFTTRPDTNFGATFIALAPEHPLVEKILRLVEDENKQEIKDYVEITKNKTEIDRQAEGREKTGVFTGFYAVNQLTGYKMPIWVSDFVLMGFGTGAVVGVPGHDKRDFEFAHKFKLKVVRVVVGKDGDKSPIEAIDQVQEEEGVMINSDFLNGLDIREATQQIMDYLEEKGYGKRQTTYHLRDWLISRQRYWGPPIPMVYCQKCADKGDSWFTSDIEEARLRIKDVGLKNTGKDPKSSILNLKSDSAGWYPAEDLPVELPYIEDFKPLGTGVSPLATHPEFYNVPCPHCGKPAKRETDVSDTFLDSAWYFLRYLATDRDDIPFPMLNPKQTQNINDKNSKQIGNWKLEIGNSSQRLAWLPVTMYIGGAEHSVLHLLYSRFITMFLKDRGLIGFEEPFARFYAHGLIIKEGAKMSKSKGNIINPDQYIKKYGADTLRAYLHFLGPFDQTGDFRDSGVEGMNRFIKRVWTMYTSKKIVSTEPSDAAKSTMHEAIKKVTQELEDLRFNTALAHMMSYYNFLSKQPEISREEAEVYLKLLAPYAPHMAEDLFQQIFKDQRSKIKDQRFESIHTSPWPEYDEKYLVSDTVKIPVQVNGKLRGMLSVASADAEDKAKVEQLAKKDEKVVGFLKGQSVKQVIYIKGKVINFVI